MMPLQLSYRLAIFYAANPDMKLTGQELARKFGVPSQEGADDASREP